MTEIRYVLRFDGIRATPQRLADALGAQTRKWPNRQQFIPSYTKDFLFKMPQVIQETDPDVLNKARSVRTFFSQNKFRQRMMLKNSGIPIPWTCGEKNSPDTPTGKFVVRPMIHSKGINYRVTDDANDFVPGSEYISAVFPKEREYRIVFVYGKPVLVVRKTVPEGTDASTAWNHHEGSRFKTVHKHDKCIMKGCGAFDGLSADPIIQSAHIVGVDVLWKQGSWVVLEYNAAPALEIAENITTVANFIKERQTAECA